MAQDFISAILGSQPDLSSILSPEQNQQLRTNANLNAAIGAIVPLLGLSGPQARPIGTGQALGAALGGAFGGYTQGFDRTLQQIVAGMQLEGFKQKRDLQKLMQEAVIPKFETVPGTQTAIPSEVGPTVIETPETRKQVGFTYDLSKIEPALLASGPQGVDLLKKLKELTMGKPVELSKEQQQYAQSQFGTTDFLKLSKPQQEQVLKFGQIPTPDKTLKNLIDAQNLVYTTGTGQSILSEAQRQHEFATGKQAPTQQQILQAGQAATAIQQQVTENPKPKGAPIPMVESPALPLQKRQELLLVQPQERAATENISRKLFLVQKDVEDLLNNTSGLKAATGFGGELTAKLSPGSAAADAKIKLDRVKQAISVNEISRMRSESKTGGAVGNMTEKEWPRFETAYGTLEQAQSYTQIVSELRKLKGLTSEISDSMINKYDSIYGNGSEIKSLATKPILLDTSGIPNGAVDMLKKNPTPQMRKFFDQKYGRGMANQVLGQ